MMDDESGSVPIKRRRSDARLSELFDRGEKFRGYHAVPSVIDYLLVAHVEHYTRGRDDTWGCASTDLVRGCA
jgi:hypothetical protein